MVESDTHSRGGLSGLLRGAQALDKLGVAWTPTEAKRACNEGRLEDLWDADDSPCQSDGEFAEHKRVGSSGSA
ncbi:hypothetical protein [Bradyrhizobium sp. 187]|uniref:hypothetical protein n=1 Tax=Bradyrhizobium sp. 187 TaxID=2782655 RepID=UPI001FFEDD96|nr:hypothetical protein [Bradyrhizobium sp. 187]UPJ71829.1 hypothetical protein IVB19_30130 [Bradyrhizobium sp. 187]